MFLGDQKKRVFDALLYCVAVAAVQQRVAPLAKAVYCFVESWAAYRRAPMAFAADHIDPHLCSHLVYAFARLDQRTHRLAPNDEEYDIVKVDDREQQQQGGSGQRVVCYFTNWSWYRKGDGKFLPEHMEPSLCTHIVYAFASLDPNDLTLKPFDSWSDIDNNFFARVVARAAAGGASVLLSMGGWTDSAGGKYSQLVSADAATRRRFAADAVQTLRRHSFDGLQLDWNYPELRQAFDKEQPRLLLSVAISGYREIIDRAYDMRALSRHAHFIPVMTFDYHGAWEHETGHVAPLYPTPGEQYPDYNVDSTIAHLVALGADKSKLVVGMPFYGQSFTLAAPDKGGTGGLGEEAVDPGESGQFTKQPGMLAYYEICYRVTKQNWKVERSEVGPYAYSGDQWVSYDDPISIKQKVNGTFIYLNSI
ncbi:hypothetical protein LSTR_LSTR012780 [Laodelphax striatellus]|uniref:GH18 domain-containing protein n=1 Tax=Laodelphax striatellus TaxID=195883 RepID=A0A482XCD1_LAOST|nr:hypothetical protein LSTR_LSTR012780 [Laodelphax striatellus]